MNLVVSNNLESITPDTLPSRRRGDRLRLLCVVRSVLGFGTLSRELQRYTDTRGDVEAVHISLSNPFWMKVFSRVSPLPGNMDLQTFRAAQQWRRVMRGWFRGPLDLDRFDAVVVSPQFFAWAFADRRARGRGPLLALHIDATTLNTIRDFGDSRLTGYPLCAMERQVFRDADVVAHMGDWAGDSAHHDYGVPRERLLWVPPTCEVLRDKPPQAPGEEDGQANRLARIVFIGNDWARKGGPELLRWHQQHWADRAELHFVGRDPVPTEGTRNVIAHGRVPRDKVVGELLPSMDIFVLPTRRDMTPWVAVEAMAAGVPTVLPRVGGIPSLMVDGVTGLLCEPGDEAGFVRAIGSLLDDPQRRRRISEASQRHARATFTPEVVYGRLIDRLKQLALAPGAAPAAAAG